MKQGNLPIQRMRRVILYEPSSERLRAFQIESEKAIQSGRGCSLVVALSEQREMKVSRGCHGRSKSYIRRVSVG